MLHHHCALTKTGIFLVLYANKKCINIIFFVLFFILLKKIREREKGREMCTNLKVYATLMMMGVKQFIIHAHRLYTCMKGADKRHLVCQNSYGLYCGRTYFECNG